MSIRGYKVEITSLLNNNSKTILAQWIGCFNVIRNQKIKDGYLIDDKYTARYSYIKNKEGLGFLKEVPCQILRGAGYKLGQEYIAFKKHIRGEPKTKRKNSSRYCFVTNELFKVRSVLIRLAPKTATYRVKPTPLNKIWCRLVLQHHA